MMVEAWEWFYSWSNKSACNVL